MLVLTVSISVFLFVTYSIFYRYFPVTGICCLDIEQLKPEHLTILDVRDYNISSSDAVTNALNIPYAYLKRYYKEISGKGIILIVSDPLLLNVTVRYLRRKHINVVGYYLKAEENSDEMINRKTCFEV